MIIGGDDFSSKSSPWVEIWVPQQPIDGVCYRQSRKLKGEHEHNEHKEHEGHRTEVGKP